MKYFVPAIVLLALILIGCGDDGTGPAGPIVEAVLSVTPESGTTLTDFLFDAGGSSSRSRALEFRWDWEDDGTWDTEWSSEDTIHHVFESVGDWTVTVEARDGDVSDTASVDVEVTQVIFTAVLNIEPLEGTVITDFVFDASGSGEREMGARSIEFRWDWEGDGTWDTDWGGEAVVTRRFDEFESYSVTVGVRDGDSEDEATQDISLNLNHGAVLDTLYLAEGVLPSGLTHDGEHFWASEWGPDEELVKFDSETGEVLLSYPVDSNWTGGLAWVDGYLWQQTYRGTATLIKIDPSDGSIPDLFEVIYTRQCAGLCWGNGGLYYGSRISEDETQGDNRIHKYDLSGNELLSFDTPNGPDEWPVGLAFDGQMLWVRASEGNEIYVVDPSDGTVSRSIEGSSYGLMVIVDSHLWVYANCDGRCLIKVVP